MHVQLTLSERQKQVTKLVCQGLPTREVGERLGLKDQAVRWHLSQVYKKYNVRSRVQLMLKVRP